MAVSIVIPYTDRKGEHGKITLNQATTFDEVEFSTFAAAKSYAAFERFDTITETPLTTPTVAGTSALMENDKDVKLCLGFQGAEGNFKIEWPAPKLNISGGFVIRWGENRAYVPPVKAVGETGDDGAALETAINTILGTTGVKFRYGRLVKKG